VLLFLWTCSKGYELTGILDLAEAGGSLRMWMFKQTMSDISFKKTFCLMNIRPQDFLSHEPTLWFRRH
jgi:hypothetical protein